LYYQRLLANMSMLVMNDRTTGLKRF
jgi:hypothetical protein